MRIDFMVLFALFCKYQHFECNAPAIENIQRFQYILSFAIFHMSYPFFAMRHFKQILWNIIFHYFFSQRDTSGSLSRTNMESWCHLLTLMLCHWPGMIWKRILSKRSCLAIFIIIPGVFPYPWANWPHGVRLVWLVLFVPFRTNPILRHFL